MSKAAPKKVIIGGKSLGGRIASMVADDLGAAGLVCLGYPFHPIGKPDQLRTAHLLEMRTPTLIVQGTRDQFGTRDEVARYEISPNIEIFWVEDGDHDLKSRKSVAGLSATEQVTVIASRISQWSDRISN